MQNQIPENWQKVKLNDLGFVGRGKSKHRPRNDSSLYGGEYPFIQTSDVKNANLYIADYSQTYNNKGLSQSKLWDPGTLLITIAANIAETAILKIPACFPDSIVGFIADPKKSDTRFVKYYIDIIKLNMQSASKGTTQDNLSLDKLLTFAFFVPEDVVVQQKVASILSAYDDLIENNNKQIKTLEEMAQAIFKEWFVHFRFPGYEEVKMVDSSLGKIPEGWIIDNIGNKFCTILGGTPLRNNSNYWENGSIPWINSGKTNEFRITSPSEYITEDGLKHSSAKLMPKRATVIAITGATLGQVSLLEIECSANQSVVGIYDNSTQGLFNEYIYLFISNNIHSIINKAGGGAQQHINKEIVEESKILVPSLSIMRSFKDTTEPIFELLANLIVKNELLQKTRDLLLPKLMRGKIRIQ